MGVLYDILCLYRWSKKDPFSGLGKQGPRTGVFCNSAMEALSRDPDIVAISKDATNVQNQLPKPQSARRAYGFGTHFRKIGL